MRPPQGFLLLSLPNCTLSFADFSETGVLGLECVTVPLPEASSDNERDVYLVLRLNMSETPIDPARVIQRSDAPHARIYTLYGTPNDPTQLTLTIPAPPGDPKSSPIHEDLDTFEGILEQYAVDFRSSHQSPAVPSQPPPAYASGTSDLRGHLVMINEDTGEVVGEVEDRFRVKEDPTMHERGRENDPVVIEVPDEVGLRESDASAMEAFARIIPPDQQDWVTKSATVVSHAVSFTTNLLLTTITTASNYYISKSAPSPHHSSSNLITRDKDTTSHDPNSPPPLPPRALVFLTSERTRQGLRNVHTVSGQAVKVSAKTVKTIDNMIRRAMGAKPKQNRLGYIPAAHGSLSPVPSSSGPHPHTSTLSPPLTHSSFSPNQWSSDAKPPVPPRRSLSPQPPTLPPRNIPSPSPPIISPPPSTTRGPPQGAVQLNPLPQPKLSKTSRLLISADLILSTIDDSARRVLDTGTESVGRIMHHKYGPEAAESSLLAAGTARNVGLVYIDMKGVGRRALLKRAGKNFVKGRFQSGNGGGGGSGSGRPVPPVPGQQAYYPQPHLKQ